MSMQNSVEYNNNYSKTLGSLWLFYRDEPTLGNNGNITDFADDNTTNSFKFKGQITGQTGTNETKNVEIMVVLKYLSHFWRTFGIRRISWQTLWTTTKNRIIINEKCA